MPFNPFDKQVDQLQASDLQKLLAQSVAEGYYVEYKGDTFPANSKIGHSIASFANTYGGWYIVGVKTDLHNVANNICGFDLATYPDPISKVREIAKSHIDPVPIFFPRVVDIGSNRAVLVVQIPADQETPFISKDGRIYRRLHDSSDPVTESNRYAVDRLVEQGRRAAERFRRFARDERVFSKREAEGLSWVNIYMSPYPFDIMPRKDVSSTAALRQILKLSHAPFSAPLSGYKDFKGNLPFNSVQPTLDSILLQQMEPAKSAFNSLCVELFADGSAKILLPLQFTLDVTQRDSPNIESVEVRETLQRLIDDDRDSDLQLLRFFDVGKLWVMLIIILAFYRQWLGTASPVSEMKLAIEIRKAWRVVPFYDHGSWSTHVDEFGIPVTKIADRRFPFNPDKGIVFNFKDAEYAGEELGTILCEAFGLPSELYPVALSASLAKALKAGETDGDQVIARC